MPDRLPVRDIEGPPIADTGHWLRKVAGHVERPRTYSIDDIRSFGATEVTVPFVCVEGRDLWVKWKGIPLRRIIEDVQPRSNACWLTFYSYSEYTDSPFIEDAMDEWTLLAYGLEAGELPLENGGPRRLIVPYKLAYESVKWLQRVSSTPKSRGTGRCRAIRRERAYPWRRG